MDKTNVLSGVEDTLYIPLVGRIYASKRFPTFFYDEKALSLEQYIPTDAINKNSGEYYYLASVCRQHTIDMKIAHFLKENPRGNVVFLGAGLETAFYRVGNDTGMFYQVDLPSVIEKREKVLGKERNEIFIAGDMFELEWVNHIDQTLPTLITVSGVYQYFHEDKIIEMIKKMKAAIPQGELVFDATNSKGLEIANKYVKKTGNTNAQMYFSVDDGNAFARKTGTTLVSVSGFFQEALSTCKGLKFKTRLFMYFADKLNRTCVFHFMFS